MSLNVRGLSASLKIRTMHRLVVLNKLDIILIQEIMVNGEIVIDMVSDVLK